MFRTRIQPSYYGNSAVEVISDLEPVRGAKLIVPNGYCAYVFHNANLWRFTAPGEYMLETRIPIYLRVLNSNGSSRMFFKVIYVKDRITVSEQFGTGPIQITDASAGFVLRIFGAVKMTYRISNPEPFILGNLGYGKEDLLLKDEVTPTACSVISSYMKDKDVITCYESIDGLCKRLKAAFNFELQKFGVEVSSVSCTLNYEEDVETLRDAVNLCSLARITGCSSPMEALLILDALKSKGDMSSLLGEGRRAMTENALNGMGGGNYSLYGSLGAARKPVALPKKNN